MGLKCMGALNLLHSAWVTCAQGCTHVHTHTPQRSPLAATSGPADGPQWACDDAHTSLLGSALLSFHTALLPSRQDTRLAVVPGRGQVTPAPSRMCLLDHRQIQASLCPARSRGAQPGTSLPRKYQLTDGVVTTGIKE